MHRVEPRVKPGTWHAFQLTAIENLPGAEVGNRLGIKVSGVFVAKHRVLKLLEEEVPMVQEERG
jgi:DNA-directed RNA polymerase specialized sigma24 family protein